MLTAWIAIAALGAAPLHADTRQDRDEPLPEVVVTHDDTVIDRSCTIVIEPGTVIEDVNGDGVIHITAPDVRVEFKSDTTLRGAKAGAAPDSYSGIGIRIAGQRGVTLSGLRLSGFKVGVLAEDCPNLTIERVEARDMFRQRLRSTPAAEDPADWLWPHNNDGHEWRTNYGAALCIERSADVTVRDCRVRESQNGLILDRVEKAKVYDNDFSFLSGWGIAMWRSCGNTIARNSLDFCIRGYSHGVYNRGQDSAGLLMFEQCSRNIVAENSITHGGDGVFGFAGKEALGETPPPTPGFDYTRRGCNDNVFAGNDLSFAAAHGLEMTFSFGNVIDGNSFKQNAICGIWGGYSRDTTITNNRFGHNGQAGYGLERGGINIEHGANNTMAVNVFIGDACGVHLWWGEAGGIKERPWYAANAKDGATVLRRCMFNGTPVGVHVRHGGDVELIDCTFEGVQTPVQSENDAAPRIKGDGSAPDMPDVNVQSLGRAQRHIPAALEGRDSIIMTEWGPWDHEASLVRRGISPPGAHAYEIFGAESVVTRPEHARSGVETKLLEPGRFGRRELLVRGGPGVHAYDVPITVDGTEQRLRGTLVNAEWAIAAFPWDEATDPRTNLDGWRALARGDRAVTATVASLSFRYGHGGPRDQPWSEGLRDRAPSPDRFGVIATTTLTLPKGKWRFTTTSDDGVRVKVGDTTVIENWTWHAPTRDTGIFEQAADGPVPIVVEHFEIDGFAVLELAIEPAE